MSIGRPDIAPLERAIERLREVLVRYQSDTADTPVRDSVVHRFEFTYELGHSLLRRYLKYASASSERFDRMNFPDLIRTASEQGLLLGGWPKWSGFRDLRNKTSHTYDEDVALDVVEGIPAFLDEISYLRDRLREELA